MRSITALALALLTFGPTQAQVERSGQPLSGEVRQHHGNPTIFVNGEPMSPYVYALPDIPGGRYTWEEVPAWNIAQFCAAGTRLFQVGVFFEDMWKSDGSLDISTAVKQIRGIQDKCPGAAVVLRYHFHMPTWWRDSHPEELTRFSDTDEFEIGIDYGFRRFMDDDFRAQPRESFASERWVSDATDVTLRFLEAMKQEPESQWLIGFHIAGGVYGEWHHWGFMYNEGDTSEPNQRYFRKWLTNKYKTDIALQRAWGRTDVTLSTAKVPGFDDRRTTAGIFRNPVEERWVEDYYRSQHDLVPERLLYFAKLMKSNWDRPLLIGSFGAYFYSLFGREAAGGNLNQHLVLESPYVDYLSAPNVYEPDDHDPGHVYRSRALLKTVRMHGKVWLTENDQEAILVNPRFHDYQQHLGNSIAIVQRNALQDLTRGNGLWWFDFGPSGTILNGILQLHRGKIGYWDHPDVMTAIAKIKTIYDEKVNQPYRSDADLLLVYDTEVFYHTASQRFSDAVNNTAINWVTLAAHYSGAAFDAIHLKDLPNIDLSQYKAVLFGNTYRLTDAEIDWIHKNVAKDGRHLIWNYAPGYTDGNILDARRLSKTTGIELERTVDFTPFPEIMPDNRHVVGGPIRLRKYGSYRQLPDSTLSPAFKVADDKATIIGRYTINGEPAMAMKRFPSHTSWYSALPLNERDVLRSILNEAGVHLYSERAGEVVYVGNNLIVYHSIRPGKHVITLRNGKQVEFDVPSNHARTAAFDATTGKRLDIDP